MSRVKTVSQPEPKLRGNQHVDIFGAKDSQHVVIKNTSPDPELLKSNVFQQRQDEAYERYHEKVNKRPASSHSNLITQPGRYTYDAEWCQPKFQQQKTQVNQKAHFGQDYHHQRRLDQLTSSIFVSDTVKDECRRIYQKVESPKPQTTRNPNPHTQFGRKSTLTRQYDNDSHRALPHNYSNLFGLGDRHTQSSKQLPPPVPLIPNKMKWEQFDSVLQQGSKDEQVNNQFHKKRYYENMKSSMDTHAQYENYLPKDETKNAKEISVMPEPAAEPVIVTYNENNQKLANLPENKVQSPKAKQTRPASGFKHPAKSIEIVIVKGLSSKFNIQNLTQQCRLHSLLLSGFQNEMGDNGLATGRGTLIVIPQKKYGLENLCSWLRSQGLTIRMKG